MLNTIAKKLKPPKQDEIENLDRVDAELRKIANDNRAVFTAVSLTEKGIFVSLKNADTQKTTSVLLTGEMPVRKDVLRDEVWSLKFLPKPKEDAAAKKPPALKKDRSQPLTLDDIPYAFTEIARETNVTFTGPPNWLDEHDQTIRIQSAINSDITVTYRYDSRFSTSNAVAYGFKSCAASVAEESERQVAEAAAKAAAENSLPHVGSRDIPEAFKVAAEKLGVTIDLPARKPNGEIFAQIIPDKITVEHDGKAHEFEGNIGMFFTFAGKRVIDNSPAEMDRFRQAVEAHIKKITADKKTELQNLKRTAGLLLKAEAERRAGTKPPTVPMGPQIADADYFGSPRFQETPGGKLVLTAVFDRSEEAIERFKAAFDQMVQTAEQHRAKQQKPAFPAEQKPDRIEGLPERYYKILRQHGVKMVNPERGTDSTTRVTLQDINPLEPTDPEPHPDIVDFEGGLVRATFTLAAKSSRAQLARFQEAIETVAASAKPFYEAARGAHIGFPNNGVRLINPKWNADGSLREIYITDNSITVTAGRGTDLKAYEFPGGLITRHFALDANRNPQELSRLSHAVGILIEDARKQRAETATRDIESGKPRVDGARQVPLPATAGPKPRAGQTALAA